MQDSNLLEEALALLENVVLLVASCYYILVRHLLLLAWHLLLASTASFTFHHLLARDGATARVFGAKKSFLLLGGSHPIWCASCSLKLYDTCATQLGLMASQVCFSFSVHMACVIIVLEPKLCERSF